MIEAVLSQTSYVLNLYAFPHLLTALFLQSLAVSILLSEKGSRLSWVFTLMTTVVSGWLMTTSLTLFASQPAVAHVWAKGRLVFISFVPLTMLLFVAFATSTYEANKPYLTFSLLYALSTTGLTLFTDQAIAGIEAFSWGLFPVASNLDLLYLLHTTIAIVLCLKWLWTQWNTVTTEPARNRSGTFLAAFFVASFAIVDVLPAYGFEIFPLGFLPVVGFCVVLSWGIIRYRIVDFSPAYAAEEMMSTMDDPLIVCDLNNTIRLINDACENVFAFDQKRLIGEPLTKLLAPSELGLKKTKALKDGELEGTQEFHFRTSENTPVDVSVSVSRLTDADNVPVGQVIVARDIRQKKEDQEEIERLAFRDNITNLPNRRYLFKEFDNLVEDLSPETGALLYLGLPNFGEVKHSLGRDMTETLLTQITKRFRTVTDESVELINWNEDEFVMVDLSASGADAAMDRARRWLETLEEPFNLNRGSFRLRASIGIAVRPDHGTGLDDLITRADLAREKARKSPSENIEVYEEGIQEETSQRILLKNSLRGAINDEELELVYHPIVSASTGEISRLEVLLRWEHPEEGFVPPRRVIELAKELDLIANLGEWIFAQACRDLARIHAELDDDSLKLSVNLSASQLQFKDKLLESIDHHIDANGFQPDNLIFEITESTAMQDIEFSRNVLRDIQDKGCDIAVDDFGTGHSSIQYLMDLPIDSLKIDKSFIVDLFRDTQNQILVETMLFMAHQLDLDVVAEGVESKRHRAFLLDNNCDYLQGFLWTEPLPLEESLTFLTEHRNGTSPSS